MRKLLTIIILTYACLIIAYSQEAYKGRSIGQQYTDAYNYILNDSINIGKAFFVVDSIIDLDRFWFVDFLNDHPQKKDLLANHRKNKEFRWDENKYSGMLDSLFKKNYGAERILLFSNIEDNMLIAELINRKSHNGVFEPIKNINWIHRFTEGYVYLFIYNDDKSIKNVFRLFMIYD